MALTGCSPYVDECCRRRCRAYFANPQSSALCNLLWPEPQPLKRLRARVRQVARLFKPHALKRAARAHAPRRGDLPSARADLVANRT
jgi:hypothetical protein